MSTFISVGDLEDPFDVAWSPVEERVRVTLYEEAAITADETTSTYLTEEQADDLVRALVKANEELARKRESNRG